VQKGEIVVGAKLSRPKGKPVAVGTPRHVCHWTRKPAPCRRARPPRGARHGAAVFRFDHEH
jgi:hypothetical protein